MKNERRGAMALMILILLAAVLATGCAGEIVTSKAATIAGDAMTVLANKIPIDSGSMEASGTIEDPQYVVDVFYVQGVRVDARLNGAKINGRLYGQGSGGNNTIDPALAELLKAQRSDPNNQTIARQIMGYLLSKSAAAEAATPAPETSAPAPATPPPGPGAQGPPPPDDDGGPAELVAVGPPYNPVEYSPVVPPYRAPDDRP